MPRYDMKRGQALKWSIAEVIARGKNPTFSLHTFWSQQDYGMMAKHWSLYLSRLQKETGFFGVRVFEFHENAGLHAHMVHSEMLHEDTIEKAREDLLVGWVRQKPVWGGDVGGYLDKELRKQFAREDAIGQRWRSFGEFEHTRIKDVVVEGKWMDCLRDAWSVREKGARKGDVEWMAVSMFRQWIENEGGGDIDYGEAYEWSGASADGNPGSGSEGGLVGVPF